MRAILAVCVAMPLCVGCASTSLERYALNQSLEITAMRYQQVIDDLAEVANNRGMLPGFALTAAGTANVTNTMSIDSTTLWDQAVKGFSKQTLTAYGQHNPDLQWTLDPPVSQPQLEGFHYACLWALIGPPPPGSRAMELLRETRLEDLNLWTISGGNQAQPQKSPAFFLLNAGNAPQTNPTQSAPLPPPPLAPVPTTPAPTPAAPAPSEATPPAATTPRMPDTSLPPALPPSSSARPNRIGADRVRPKSTPEVILTTWEGGATASPPPGSHTTGPSYHLDVARQLAALPPGWLHVCPKHRAPKHVAYKATRGNTTVWVAPEGMAGLSQFTLVMLDIATIDPTSLPLAYPTVQVAITPAKTDTAAGASGQATGAPTDQAMGTASTGAPDEKITEVWDAGQPIPYQNPSCPDPAIVAPIGTIYLSRRGSFQHASSTRPVVMPGGGITPVGSTTPNRSPRQVQGN